MCKYCIFTMDWTSRISYVFGDNPARQIKPAQLAFERTLI